MWFQLPFGTVEMRRGQLLQANWFPEGTDIKCFVIFLDFYINSDKELKKECKQCQYLKEHI